MKSLKQTAIALASVSLLTLAVPGVSHANVLSTAMIDMNNFVIKDGSSAGAIVTQGNQINVINFFSAASQTVTFAGGAPTTNTNPASTTGINFLPICQGPNCNPILPNDTFPVLTGPTANSYAAADQLETGAPINGLALSSPAHVANGAYVGVSDTVVASGHSDSNNTLNVLYDFISGVNGKLNFSFDIRSYLEAFVSGTEAFFPIGTGADAKYNFGFKIVDTSAANAVVFDWSPDGVLGTINAGTEVLDPYSLNEGLSAQPIGVDFKNMPTGQVAGVARTGTFSADTLALVAGHRYQLNAHIDTIANANRVPEPSVLALLGLGLLGMGLSRRRKAS